MAVAEASFNISIDSMSPGLILDKGFRPEAVPTVAVAEPASPALLSLYIGNPSITYNGSLPPVIELPPRMRTIEVAPGAPEVEVTCTPETKPCKASTKDVGAASF